MHVKVTLSGWKMMSFSSIVEWTYLAGLEKKKKKNEIFAVFSLSFSGRFALRPSVCEIEAIEKSGGW